MMSTLLKEARNQAIHFALGGIVSWLIMGLTSILFGFEVTFRNSFTAILGVIIMAITVEVCQYLYNDARELKLQDRLIDFGFYVLASLSTLFLLF